MVKVNVYDTKGTKKETVDLPALFSTPIRPDIIKKSFTVMQSNKRQPYGSSLEAGTRHATVSVGKGRGMSRVPRLTQGRTAALAPCVVGGRRAHPPRVTRVWNEKINKKEKKLACYSALAATSSKDLVKQRGHLFNEDITLPVIIDDSFESLKKTKEMEAALKKLGVYDDVERAKNGKHIRAGKGKTRGRKYKVPKSILIISPNDTIKKVAKNFTGVDVIHPKDLNIEFLAPGGVSGRLTLMTVSTLSSLGGET
jgi:large subunit ribosomal protein L4e